MGPDGRPIMTETLSPDEQWAYNQNNVLRSATNSRLMESFPALTAGLDKPLSLAGGPMMGLDPRFAPQAGDIQRDAGLGQAGPIQSGLDFSGAPGMPVASDQTRQAVSDAVYRQGSRYLDPQFSQQQDALDTMLANQGITRGTVSQEREQGNLDRAKMMAYGDLGDRATQQGISAMDKLFGEQLAARSQGVGETVTQGQFLNSAQQQAANELLASMAARNSAATTGANIANQSSGAYNAARQQAFNEMITGRTTGVNLINAMRTGQQTNMPSFQPNAPTSITPPPTMTGAYLQGQQNAANATAQNQLFGGLLSTGLNYYQQSRATQPAAPVVDQSGGGVPGYNPGYSAVPGSGP
jgi:hypothetical protein